MSEQVHLFVDFDDTLSDFDEHGRKYIARLSSLFSTEFGGSEADWTSHLLPAIAASLERYAIKFGNNPQPGFADWAAGERVKIVGDLFGEMERNVPATETPLAVANRLQWNALISCGAALPGSMEALAEIRNSGVQVHMASSWGSQYLSAALIGAGLENYVGTKFGPDLVDCPKEGPEFYRRIFQLCGVRPERSIVLDDQAMCLDWAEQAGARVIQACVKPNSPAPAFATAVRNLSELPVAVRQIASQGN